MAYLTRLEVCRRFSIDPAKLRSASGVQLLLALNKRRAQEVDFLEELPLLLQRDPQAAFALFGQRLRDSLTRGMIVWLGTLSPQALAAWQELLGHDLVQVVGGIRDGQYPAVITPGDLALCLAQDERFHSLMREALHGLDTLRIPRDRAEALENAGIGIRHRSRWERWLRDPTVIAYVVVFVYSTLRVLPVTFVDGFEGSLWVLWGLDIATAIPYTWGVVTMVAGKTSRLRLTGLAVTLITFLTPYAYFWLRGSNYPTYVVVVVYVLIGASLLYEALKVLRSRKLDRELLHV
ncbi:hypothetical protein ACUH92_04840 [Dermabacteraceae bacterium CCM 9520]